MKMESKILGGILLLIFTVFGSREILTRKTAAAPKPPASAAMPQDAALTPAEMDKQFGLTDKDSLAYKAYLNGVNFYPNAGKVIKGEGNYTYESYKPGTPTYQVDPAWPKFPHYNWIIGQVPGVAIDAQDNVWVISRPRTLGSDAGRELAADLKSPQADCCVPAPPVMEFDPAGNFIQGWGGPGKGYEWPETEHGIHVDYKGNVWITTNGARDNQILKFTNDGKFLLQIGHSGKSKGSLDTENLNRPTGIFVYAKTNEVFVSDGYTNKRVIVFDADTGKFKRMWGAYGHPPDDSVGPSYSGGLRAGDLDGSTLQQFNTPHCVRISNDDLLYVCDRTHNRIQVFKPDGTYVTEFFVARQSTVAGAPDGVAFSPDREQKFLFVTDSADQHVLIYDRKSLQVVGSFGRMGHFVGQSYHMHGIASDSKGNIYVAEGILGMRVDKFMYKGPSKSAGQ